MSAILKSMNKPLAQRRVVVGVTGGIAAYKACEVVSRLKKLGAEVDVIMTENAAKLVQPIGTLRINYDGYLDRKVSDLPGPPHRRWHPVHRLVWEAAHGPVPKGHVVVFLPGKFSNIEHEITLDRVELITRRELMRRNSVHTVQPPELARITQLRGALARQINRLAGDPP